MSSIRIEYTNAEGDFFEVNMESYEVYEVTLSGDDLYRAVKDRDRG